MSFEIKAIIFDYGNVLCEPQSPEDVQAMAAALGLATDKLHEIYWRDRVAYDRDDMNSTEYWNRVAGRQLQAAKIPKPVQLGNKSPSHPRERKIPSGEAAPESGLPP